MGTALITAPSWLNAKEWTEDCYRWRGVLLTGVLSHWCWDWDMLPVDETTMEITSCGCFTSQSNTGG